MKSWRKETVNRMDVVFVRFMGLAVLATAAGIAGSVTEEPVLKWAGAGLGLVAWGLGVAVSPQTSLDSRNRGEKS